MFDLISYRCRSFSLCLTLSMRHLNISSINLPRFNHFKVYCMQRWHNGVCFTASWRACAPMLKVRPLRHSKINKNWTWRDSSVTTNVEYATCKWWNTSTKWTAQRWLRWTRYAVESSPLLIWMFCPMLWRHATEMVVVVAGERVEMRKESYKVNYVKNGLNR